MALPLNRYTIWIALFVLNISCAKKEQKPFSFVQLCDTQLGMGGYMHDLKTFKQAVKQINALNPDFVVICGDLVDKATDSSYADFKSIMKGFKVPCHVAPGNHDIGNTPNDTTLHYYRKTIGKDYYQFQHKDYSFIVTNTQLWKVNVKDESETHDHWFKETLKAQQDKQYPVFVVGHYPLYLESPEEEEQYFNLPMEKRQELLDLFVQHKVVAYLSGHTHKLVVNNYKDIQLVSGETTSKNFDDRPFGFRLWKVSPDSIAHHFVALLSPIEKQNKTTH
ncbi:metallophosphoesterase [Aestuariivivens insulae]|uniref:metallophosphoesterase n=1 Tax=Aestuariivivens insulae TaxID=1621988 RepID=UPI001F583BA0|nr:metallophosphoesterase [Aestuariivivens insulae]